MSGFATAFSGHLHSRTSMYRAAWVLYALSLSSGMFVIGTAVEWNRAFPQGFGRIGLLAVVVFILGLFTNVVFWAAHVALRSPRISTSWRVLLLGSLLVDASVVFLIPEFASVGGYWLWLLAFAITTWAFLMLPADAVPAPGPRTAPADRHPEASISTDVPGLLWVWLGLTMFWLAVMVVNYYEFFHHPRRAAEIVVKPATLTDYVTDEAHLFQPGGQVALRTALRAFTEETSNQIAVAIYPRSPSPSIEDFTVTTAALSGIGRSGLNNGAILFVFLAERTARIEVGYGLEGALPDALAERILDEQLVPRFARGEYEDGVQATLAAMTDAVRGEFGSAHGQNFFRLLYPELKVAVIKVAKRAWPLARDAPLEARIGVSFFGSLLALVLWGGVVNGVNVIRSIGLAGWNLLRRRPMRSRFDQTHVDFESIWDAVKLLVIFAVIASTMVMVAGGGAFGGAGAMTRWPAIHASR
jgi:uncharacterized membrane protein YgcG